VLNGVKVATTDFANIPASGGYWSPAESLDVGSDLGSAVSKHYQTPFRFNGTIDSIILQLHGRVGDNSARNDGHS